MIILHFRKITLEQHGDWLGREQTNGLLRDQWCICSETNGVSAAATHDRKGHGGSKTTQSGAMITTGNGGGVGA